MKWFLLIAALICAVLFPVYVTAQEVPPSFQPIYSLDQNYLDSFNSTLSAGGAPPPYAGLECGSLIAADSNAGPSLLNSDPTQQLNALKALGVQCIEVHVSFPLLYEPFMTGVGQSMAAYQTFYANLSAQIHALGLKVMVESTALFTSSMTSRAGWDTAPFYATLNWTQYQQARAQTVLNIAQAMQPDYLVVLEEPDTEALNTGQTNINTSSGANAMLAQILAGLQTERKAGMKIGAGVGTWLPGFQPFIQGFVAQPMDFIDTHIYPVNKSFLPNALTIASIAATAKMPMSMTECWMHKELDSEINILTPDQVSSRSVFSFWTPLDEYFLQTMRNMGGYIPAHYGNPFLFINSFGTNYYFAYQTYNDETAGMSPSDLLSTESTLAVQATRNAQYTSTGMNFYANNLSSPDKAAPTVPPGLSGVSANPDTVSLTWSQSSDNVGVAGYYLLRNGSRVATTAQIESGILPVTIYYQDSGLSESTTYTYNVQAFDLAGNLSPLSPDVKVQTWDTTAPTPPGSLKAIANSAQKVTLSWTPSTDNIGVNSYLVFCGASPTNLTQCARLQGTATSYINYPLTAGTAYYYGVEATDKSGNASAMSTASTTTPKVPSAPTGLSATTPSAKRLVLTWNTPPSGGLSLQYFQVFRGNSATDLQQVGSPAANTYTDVAVSPGATYYYAVAAVDTGGDISPKSTVLRVVMPDLPPAPSGLAATPTTTTKIGLAWTPVTGSLPITCYYIFRGTTASKLSQIGNSTKGSFTDGGLSPATKYFYAVQAVDSGGDLSAMSATVPATTLALPSAPVNLTAVAVSKAQINLSWAAGPSGMPLSSFKIFRGTTASNLTFFKQTAAGTTSATDYPVPAGTTYYYEVEEIDTGGNISPMSKVVSATTPAK